MQRISRTLTLLILDVPPGVLTPLIVQELWKLRKTLEILFKFARGLEKFCLWARSWCIPRLNLRQGDPNDVRREQGPFGVSIPHNKLHWTGVAMREELRGKKRGSRTACMVEEVGRKDPYLMVSPQGQGFACFVQYCIPSLGAHSKSNEWISEWVG